MTNQTTSLNPAVSKVSVALSPREIKIVEKLEKKLGLNFSSALRIIVREWDELKPNGSGGAHYVGKAPVNEPVAGVEGEKS